MADLEEMGLILQPHTSAGRIPSDQGYRVYVDEMLREKDKEVEEMKEMLLDKEEKLENLIQRGHHCDAELELTRRRGKSKKA